MATDKTASALHVGQTYSQSEEQQESTLSPGVVGALDNKAQEFVFFPIIPQPALVDICLVAALRLVIS